jgi:hypothetical protein
MSSGRRVSSCLRPQPIPTRIYRITHLANLPDTLRPGIFCRNHLAPATNAYHNIGSASLTDRRTRIAGPLPPGGFLNDYVPFYLSPRSPTRYRISRHQPRLSTCLAMCNISSSQVCLTYAPTAPPSRP